MQSRTCCCKRGVSFRFLHFHRGRARRPVARIAAGVGGSWHRKTLLSLANHRSLVLPAAAIRTQHGRPPHLPPPSTTHRLAPARSGGGRDACFAADLRAPRPSPPPVPARLHRPSGSRPPTVGLPLPQARSHKFELEVNHFLDSRISVLPKRTDGPRRCVMSDDDSVFCSCRLQGSVYLITVDRRCWAAIWWSQIPEVTLSLHLLQIPGVSLAIFVPKQF